MSQSVIPLPMISPGEVVNVVGVNAGRGLSRKLVEMGLTPGVEIRVVNNQMPGPVIIEFRGSKLALGHGAAQKVMVSKAA